MPLEDWELEGVVQGITDAIVKHVEKQIQPLREQIQALEARPSGVKYCGVWSVTSTYDKDEACTWDGSMWVALTKSTSMKPGASPGAWQLAVKRGADGKSAS